MQKSFAERGERSEERRSEEAALPLSSEESSKTTEKPAPVALQMADRGARHQFTVYWSCYFLLEVASHRSADRSAATTSMSNPSSDEAERGHRCRQTSPAA